MIDTLLHARLQPVIESRRRAALWRNLALVWLAVAAAAWTCVWFQRNGAEVAHGLSVWLVMAGLLATGASWLHARFAQPDLRRLARLLEARHPDLDGRLLTAIQQQPDKKGDYNFLQDRLFEDAVRHSVHHDWAVVAPRWRVMAGRVAAGLALVSCVGAFGFLRPSSPRPVLASTTGGESTDDGVTVTPGDASIERGSSFTVMVRFDQAVPATAELIVGASAASERRLPLVRSLADPVFGGTLPNVDEAFAYRIEYQGRRTRDFNVSVYEHPRLERSDIELTPPAYTGLPPQRIEDTRRVSAVEGTRLALALQLNKPVASASLVPKTDKKEEKVTPIALAVDPGRAVATLADFPLTVSQSFELRLVDADGRANKVPDLFVFEAFPNRPPEMKLTAPRGDLQPSALEEIEFQGTAWDDFGVLAFGIGLAHGGEEAQIMELGRDVPAKEKAAFRHLLQLEALGAKPDELYSWFVWADDIGPDGQRRRTQGDLFFAEVRPFDEIFQEGAGMEGGEQESSQEAAGGAGGAPATRLAELQKQIINATWKLQRSAPAGESYAKDAEVVRDSQQQALEQAKSMAGEVEEPMRAAQWSAVTGEMEKAVSKLAEAPAAPAALPEALVAGQSAYQALLKLRERETEVNRSRRPQQGQASSGEQQRQDQLEELELEQAENRYETQRQAQPQQNAERRAQMQVQNRLQELAQRQEDVNEKLKELQTALQAAADDAQREELRRQLKRLEEEQRQMLADMDELRQRMDRPEAQSQMAQQREQLEQTRQDAQRAAEAAAEGDVSQALAAGTRAQRQLQEMREQLRRESAGQLAEELRQMRAEARDLARQQQSISESLAGENQPQRPSLADTPTEEKTLEQLNAQRERTAELVERATRLSDEAEGSEPLVSRQLYDTVRQFSQEDASTVKRAREELIREGEMTRDLYDQLQELEQSPKPGQTLSLTSELLRAELDDPAQRAARQAEAGLEQLRGGVERAAEKVLGDDTAALQAAEKELEALAAELAREAAAARGASTPPDPTDPTQAADRPDGALAEATGQRPGQQDEGPPTGEPTDEQNARARATSQPSDGQPAGAETASAEQPGDRPPGGEPQPDGAQPGAQGQGESPGAGGEPDAARQARARQAGNPPEGAQPSQRGQEGGQEGGEAQADGEQGSSEQDSSLQANAGQPGGQAGGRPQGGQPQDGQQAEGQEAGGQQAGRGGGGPQRSGRPGESAEAMEDRISRLMDAGGNPTGGRGGGAPIEGEGFTDWSDRLREVEEMIEFPDLRTSVASARERARVLRLEAKRDQKKPDWAVVELEILAPLVEVRQQVRNELRRRSNDEQLAPIDRDPVPERFADLVRRYYEELGRDP